jgi:hypothetical protein
MAAGGAVAVMAVGYLAGMDHWLRATQAAPLAARFAIAAASIAPLAFAMGHMLPSAVRQLVGSADALVPWGWAANGFASVIATVGAPLLAMQIGFTLVTCLAAACYAAAAVMSCLLPAVAARPDRGRPGCRPVWP